MGLSNKTTKKTEASTATTTPNLPTTAQPVVDNIFTKANSLLGTDPSSLVPKANGLQTQAMQGAGGLSSNEFATAQGLLGNASAAINGVKPAALPAAYTPVTGKLPTAYDPVLGMTGELPTAVKADLGFLGDVQAAGASGARASDFLDAYKDPGLEALVTATMNSFDHNAERQRAQFEREAALNKGLGGSGYFIGGAELAGEQGRTRALTDAELRDKSYARALEAASGDAERSTNASVASMQSGNQLAGTLAGIRGDVAISDATAKNRLAELGFTAGNDMTRFNATTLNDTNRHLYDSALDMDKFNATTLNDANKHLYDSAADMNQFNADLSLNRGKGLLDVANSAGSLASTINADTRANIGTQAAIGDSAYGRDQQAALSPYTQLQLINELVTNGGLLSTATGQTINSSGTSTSKQNGGLLGALAAAAQIAGTAASFSDRRLKRGIAKVGEMADGLGLYRWSYLWGEPGAGVMADEVAKLRPWALGPTVMGFDTVDYGAL